MELFHLIKKHNTQNAIYFIALILSLFLSIYLQRNHLPRLENPLFLLWINLILLTLFIFYKRFKKATLFLFILSLALYRGEQELPLNFEEKQSCTGLWHIHDFPNPNLGFAERIPLKLKQGDCPFLRNAPLFASDYKRHNLQAGQNFHATLNISASKNAYFTTLEQIQIAPTTWSIAHYRTQLAKRIDTLYQEQKKWVRALLIGERSLLTPNDRNDLKRTGTSHLLAISGLHLAVVMASIYLLTLPIASFSKIRHHIEPRTLAILSALLLGLAFALISGAQAPILRAWLMFFALLSIWLGAPLSTGITALATAGIAILIIHPSALQSLSAQLSFIATAAVILTIKHLKNKNPLTQWILLQTSITLCLLPLTWAFFSGISPIGLFINLIVIPWLFLILIALLLSLAFPILTPFAKTLLTLYLKPIHWGSAQTWAWLEPNYQPSASAALLLSLALLLLYGNAKRLSLATLFLSLFFHIAPLLHAPTRHITTREGIMILYPQAQQAIIINTGYNFRGQNDAERHILPELRRHNARPIAIILTHDSAHTTGGLRPLLKRYPQTPIYTFAPSATLSFAHQSCPQNTPKSIEFQRKRYCLLKIHHQDWGSAPLNREQTRQKIKQTP